MVGCCLVYTYRRDYFACSRQELFAEIVPFYHETYRNYSKDKRYAIITVLYRRKIINNMRLRLMRSPMIQ